MAKYMTAPNGTKIQIVEDKRSASGYRAVPMLDKKVNMPLQNPGAHVKKAFGQAGEDAAVRKMDAARKSSRRK